MSKSGDRKLFWTLILLLTLIVADGRLRLCVSRYDCPVSALPAEFEDFCIVQLSDLHGEEFGRGNKRLLKKVRSCEPDIIALTGDFIENAGDLRVTARLLPELAAIAPC